MRAQRVAVTEEPPFAGSFDYADAFRIARAPTDPRSAERWARDGFEELPLPARHSVLLIHRWVLGFSLGPWDSPAHVFGWRIATSEPEMVHLEASSKLLKGDMVWRLQGNALTMNTFLRYQRPSVARPLWATLGNIHRGGSYYLLHLAATAPQL